MPIAPAVFIGSSANLLRLLIFLSFLASAAAVVTEDALGHDSAWAKAAVVATISLLVGQHLPNPTDPPTTP